MNRFPLRLATLVATLGLPLGALHAEQKATNAKQSPQDLIDALHSAFGDNHSRAVHAKGTILTGTFKASPEARTLSASSIFSGVSMPVTARFSDFTGIPTIPDTVPDANPRGFAVKFQTKNDTVDIVTHSFNGFPVATSDEFAVFLRDIGSSGAGVAHPTPIEEFLGSHPIAKTFVTSQKPPPLSYATSSYFGVNSFEFTNAARESVFVRYRLVPGAGEHYLTPDEIKGRGPDYLQEELRDRIDKGPIEFEWYAQVAKKGDKIENPSIAWPEERELVKLGTISILALAPDEAAADKATLFLPGQKHFGIRPADPMLTLRNHAYPLSFKGRQ
jgi:catalase